MAPKASPVAAPAVNGEAILRERVVLAMATAFVGGLHVAGFAGVRLDDAYITYRYGENLARGRGLVFNPGERLLGTSAPGHALIAAAVHLLAGHDRLPAIMSAIGALAWTAQAVLLYALLRPSGGVRTAAVAALGIAAGAAQSYWFVALETNLLAALVLGAIVLGIRRRWWLCGVTLGAAVVVRGDALLAAAPLLALAIHDLRRGAWRFLTALSVPVAGWIAPATAFFGTPLPHTLAVKARVSTIGTYATHEAIAPLGNLVALAGRPPVVCGVAAWALAAWGWSLVGARNRRVFVLPAWGALHAGAYLALRPDVAFLWHIYPVLLAVVCGLSCLLGRLLERLRAASAAAAIAVATCVFAWGTLVFSVEYPKLLGVGVRDRVDRDIAAFLRDNANPGDVVDAEEVGTIAYFSDLPMLDHPGLVTRADRAGLDVRNLTQAHCRALADIPRLRFLIVNRLEIESHRCLYGDRVPLAFGERAYDGIWALWVVDRFGTTGQSEWVH